MRKYVRLSRYYCLSDVIFVLIIYAYAYIIYLYYPVNGVPYGI